MFKVPNEFRVRTGRMRSTAEAGNNGLFHVRSLKLKRLLQVIASDGMGWEHVSVSLHDRLPTWKEMDHVKRLFWDDEDFVVSMHVPTESHVNNHSYCLHLWRKAGTNDYCERPPDILVGVKGIAA